jgi:hypothetical protein
MSRRQQSQIPQTVAAGTLVLGASLVAAPVLSGRLWQLDPGASPVVPHLIRMYGLTLGGLGAATLRPGSDPVEMMRVATGVGASTALAWLLAGLRGRVGARGAVMGVATAAGLAALAATAVRTG